MDKFDRVHALHKRLAGARHPVSAESLMRELECTRATLTRLISYMRDFLNAPIVTNHTTGGYRYQESAESKYQLPGLWFNPSELYALIASLELLRAVQPGLLQEEIAPLRQRIEILLAREQLGAGEAQRRLRILPMAARQTPIDTFRVLADALLQRRQCIFQYHARGSDAQAQRTVSPQRMTRYRDNWYLDAWCHQAEAVRTYAMDRIQAPRATAQAAIDCPEEQLDTQLAGAYGIFSGTPDKQAVLRFNAYRARWVAGEIWHPQQQGRLLADGSYELTIPYRHPQELVLDILRYGPEVEVIEPASLREEVAARLRQAAAIYSGSASER